MAGREAVAPYDRPRVRYDRERPESGCRADAGLRQA